MMVTGSRNVVRVLGASGTELPKALLSSVVDDKLDSSLRKETLGRLWCLHSAFYNLSSLVFCKAVCLMDLFIAKVKVKPKYAMCAAAACYYIASKFERTADVLLPTPDSLVMLSRCGGSAIDFTRMVEIILSKLTPTLVASVGGCSATALDFLKVFTLVSVNKAASAHQLQFDSFGPAYSSINLSATRLSPFLCRQLEVALTSTEAASFRPSCLALALLSLYCVPNSKASTIELDENLCCNGPDLFNLAQLCGVHWSEVETCKMAIQDTLGTPKDIATIQDYPSSRLLSSSPPMVWTLSRRTQRSISTSSPPSLPTIDELEEDTVLLSSRLSILELSTAPKTTHTNCSGTASRPSRS
ncbi:hypothetical protein EG68_01188 [Paragonimus skrjabini miyazakii]|uniref:Cyclin N-terminal domain-containing protein n=1 Tax=Paragonimus skrjabini miyazakii TaxID=59628 RepID=A0A8S9Z749_9TREM|nr:hypothetical protein EG68_01188 [Paragonimus skrjabini miyazakii]